MSAREGRLWLFQREWQRKFAILRDSMLFIYHANKEPTPFLSLHLCNATVSQDDTDGHRPFSFFLVCASHQYQLAALDDEDVKHWLDELCSASMKGIPASQPPKRDIASPLLRFAYRTKKKIAAALGRSGKAKSLLDDRSTRLVSAIDQFTKIVNPEGASRMHDDIMRSAMKLGALMSGGMVSDAVLISVRTHVATIFVSIVNFCSGTSSPIPQAAPAPVATSAEAAAPLTPPTRSRSVSQHSPSSTPAKPMLPALSLDDDDDSDLIAARQVCSNTDDAMPVMVPRLMRRRSLTSSAADGMVAVMEVVTRFNKLRAVVEEMSRTHMKPENFARLSGCLQFYSQPMVLQKFFQDAKCAQHRNIVCCELSAMMETQPMYYYREGERWMHTLG
eukprot:TRINITY_DN14707_c0_g1_i1.p1 TRINITY_DN14707_c0_g1~~TRINITY_DN14707_c0_g1_i1.p1  ORF type:complete len:390 (+),score=56.19 TRINITY_DN14707_c0_g1_i1:76-1245(+)